MNSRDFCYWLQGLFELTANPNGSLDARQCAVIREHLALVFQQMAAIAPVAPGPIALPGTGGEVAGTGHWPHGEVRTFC